MPEPSKYRYSNEDFGFYIASSDHDILNQVSRVMARSGYVGVMDTAGRLQYIVDGRKGSPHAARRIMDAAGRTLEKRQIEANPILGKIGPAADQVLCNHNIPPELKGYRFLRYILLFIGLDESKLRPVSKTLYPAASEHFRVTISQVERDIRYALSKTDFKKRGLTGAAAICRLYDEMIKTAEDLLDKEKPFISENADEGRD